MDLSIIGGQDGPTAVLTSGGPAGLILTLLLIGGGRRRGHLALFPQT